MYYHNPIEAGYVYEAENYFQDATGEIEIPCQIET